MKKNWKEELLPALLAGAICGIIALLGLVFLAPGKWYLALVVFAVMSGVSLYVSANEKEKNAVKYARDEHLIEDEWFCSAEGFIRRDSDKKAKFYFGENGVTVLRYKNVKPIIENIPMEKIGKHYFDRCGWLAIMVPEDNMRIVIPKEKAKETWNALCENGWEEEAENAASE